ncbi:MAG: right-handed parallel beta-helix repeat-containing protein, partial [Candidatus Thorarchaeota archaeon]
MIIMEIKDNKRKIIQKFAFLCFLTLLFSSLTGLANDKDIQINKSNSLSLITHESIFIDNDNNFTDYGFSGAGTKNSPYIIENYNITTTVEYGLVVVNTTKHFIIRNCYVDAFQRGIKITNASDNTVTISNNICPNNNFAGIHISETNYVTVSNNTCPNTLAEGGIAIFHSSHVNITDNTCIKTKQNYGIYIYKSHYCLITNNLVKENRLHGIYVSSESSNCVIHHNSIIDNNLEGTSQAWDS